MSNRKLETCLYSDNMIYSPKTPVFKTDSGDLLEKHYNISFLTSPAVNAGVVRDREKKNIAKIDAVMLQRLDKILAIAVVKNYKTLLLGAWGCGVFRNNPTDVASYFKQQLCENPIYTDYFEKIVFAIYCPGKNKENLEAFSSVFNK